MVLEQGVGQSLQYQTILSLCTLAICILYRSFLDILTTFCITARQSPIDIITNNVREDESMTPLVFSSTWSTPASFGSFINNGHSVQFTLNGSSPTTTTGTPVGGYEVVQLHFHWGNQSGQGSEHRVDGMQDELEIHFVHSRVGGGSDPGQSNAVVGVFAKEDNTMTVSGIWQQLDPTQVPNSQDSIAVSGITLSNFLPSNRDYYYYEGSLTTPDCTESVQWFVLKNRIKVPSAFLATLRSGVQGADGTQLVYNFRDVQAINSRVVMTQSGSIVISGSALSVMLVALVALLSLN